MGPRFSETKSSVTEGIRVSVRTAYLPQESNAEHDHYVFAYKIQIMNESAYQVQLLSRQWFIIDALGRRREVNGEGVVGQQPELDPTQRHSYISGCTFRTPIGQMAGYYTFVRKADGRQFRVRIPAFTMILPSLLN